MNLITYHQSLPPVAVSILIPLDCRFWHWLMCSHLSPSKGSLWTCSHSQHQYSLKIFLKALERFQMAQKGVSSPHFSFCCLPNLVCLKWSLTGIELKQTQIVGRTRLLLYYFSFLLGDGKSKYYLGRGPPYAHRLCITSPPVRLPAPASQRALSNQLNSCLNRQAIKAAETEDGDHCWKSTRRQNERSFPLGGPPNSPGDPECYRSICGNKCLVPRLSDIIAFGLPSLWVGIVSLCGLCWPVERCFREMAAHVCEEETTSVSKKNSKRLLD